MGLNCAARIDNVRLFALCVDMRRTLLPGHGGISTECLKRTTKKREAAVKPS
jgi:hypothetical protein